MFSIRFAVVSKSVSDAVRVFSVINSMSAFEFCGIAEDANELSTALENRKVEMILVLNDADEILAVGNACDTHVVGISDNNEGGIKVTSTGSELSFAKNCSDYISLFGSIEAYFASKRSSKSVGNGMDLRVLFTEVGIPGHLNGGIYLEEILKTATDEYGLPDKLSKTVLPKVAAKFKKPVHCIVRSAGFAIERAHNSGELYNINKITGQRLIPIGYKPGLKEFVFLMLDAARILGIDI